MPLIPARLVPRRPFVELIYHVQDCLLDVATMILLLSRLYLVFSVSFLLFQPALEAAKFSVCTTFPTTALCRPPTSITVNTTSICDVDDDATGFAQYPSRPPEEDSGVPAMFDVAVVDVVNFDPQRRVLQPLPTGSRTPLGLESLEITLRGLSTFAKATNVAGNDVLTHSLEKFAIDARTNSQGIQRLFSKLHGVINDILGFSEFAAHKLKTPAGSKSLDVYYAFARTFQDSMDALSSEVAGILVDTTAIIENLDILDEQLAALHSFCEQERITTSVSDGLFSKWWNYLGGDGDRAMANQRLVVLENVNRHRALAVEQVGILTHVLTAIEADLAELRERLKAPASVKGLPVEVYIASIDMGARRLKERVGADRWQTVSTNAVP